MEVIIIKRFIDSWSLLTVTNDFLFFFLDPLALLLLLKVLVNKFSVLSYYSIRDSYFLFMLKS